MRDKITQKVFQPGAINKQLIESQQGEVYKDEEKDSINKRLAYIETYGCQMNFSDTEIVASQLKEMDYGFTADVEKADLVFINTCSIRENAEAKVWNRLHHFRKRKERQPNLLIGILGCMAERLKSKLLEESQLVDMVVGPDAYRDLPKLIAEVDGGQRAVNVLLSREETYADISPVRLNSNGVTAFVTIMRGCDNMCSFCVVPFTRGRERSRDPYSIVREVIDLSNQGYKEVTLLGQNVDSYTWSPREDLKGKAQILKEEKSGTEIEIIRFPDLLDMVARAVPHIRIRFSTSHPKDITDDVLFTMAHHSNICKYIHLPLQSGSSRILEQMNRGYTAEWYKEKINRIRTILPNCAISSDIITGFCTETEEDHQQTIQIMQYAGFSQSFMFAYSERPGTAAAKKWEDDVPLALKKRRLSEVIALQNELSTQFNQATIGKVCEVLVEGDSKRSKEDYCGRTDQNQMVVFPKKPQVQPGDYVNVQILSATSATLKGAMIDP